MTEHLFNANLCGQMANRVLLTLVIFCSFFAPGMAEQASPDVPPSTITVRVEGSEAPKPTYLVLKFIADLAWPTLFGIVLLTQRQKLGELLRALVVMMGSAKTVRFGRDLVSFEIDRSAAEAKLKPPSNDVPREQLYAAARVEVSITTAEFPLIHKRMLEFAVEYETTRDTMSRSGERTRAMDAIVAKMRTLALAARPFLAEFSEDQSSSGKRLAAICILQLSPDLNYVGWLVDRFREEQPFVFFHASIALLETVQSYGSVSKPELKKSVEQALATVRSFKGGTPDKDTIDVLTTALKNLQQQPLGSN